MLIRSKIDYGSIVWEPTEYLRGTAITALRALFTVKYVANISTKQNHPNYQLIFKHDEKKKIKTNTAIHRNIDLEIQNSP